MNEFFKRYSYSAVKLFVTQVAIGLFGAVLALATSESDLLMMITSIFAVLFYMFLIYTSVWEIGAKDRISIDCGKMKPNAAKGLFISLLANIPNFIIGIIISVCWFISHGAEGAATDTLGVMRVVTLVVEGMYYGLLKTVPFLGTPYNYELDGQIMTGLNPNWWSYFVIIIPAILVTILAYWLGTRNFHLTKMMEPLYPESDREPKLKKDRKD